MTLQLSASVRNARLDAVETVIGTAPLLCLYTGTMPASTVTTYTGSVVAEFALPSDWLVTAATGTKVKAGTWSGTSSASGIVGYFRIKDTGGIVHLQGVCTVTGGGGDMTLDSLSVTSGQPVTVATFTLNESNA